MHRRTIRRVKRKDSDPLLLLDYLATILYDVRDHNREMDSSRL